MKQYFRLWLNSYNKLPEQSKESQNRTVDWVRILPFIMMHLACLLVFLCGFSWFAFWFAVGFYILRMFAITGFYHRYFSHKSFKTSRSFQFIFALIGASSTQKGVLWWSAHHRHHHRYSDQENDVHSNQHGFFWSHMGWFLSRENTQTKHEFVKDWVKFPELVCLDRHAMLIPVITGVAIWCLGAWLEYYIPSLQTNGFQLLIWGFFISTIFLTHATLLINSMAHRVGKQDFHTGDESRNNFFLALITLGEGWHNNHHFSSGCARQGFYWWQIDITYYILKLLSWCGLVWDLKPVPNHVYTHSISARNQGAL